MGYKRKMEDNRRLKKLYDETKNWYGAGAYYDSKKGRYIKYSPSDRRQTGTTKYYRRRCNKRFRKASESGNYGNYKRYFDYWWELL